MGKTRGFRLGRKLVRVFSRFIRRRSRRKPTYTRLTPPMSTTEAAISKLFEFGRSLKQGAKKGLCFRKQGRNSGYIRAGGEPVENPVSVPKGHLAVYVGEKDDDTCRVLVPVIYFNHPLFGELLKEAEKVYGYDHQGGIQIPCRKSEFENVKMRIAATDDGSHRSSRRGWRPKYW